MGLWELAAGYTIVMQLTDLTSVVQSLKFLRRNPTILFPLVATVSAWFPHER